MKQIKECIFCNTKPLIKVENTHFRVECAKCSNVGFWHEEREMAISIWNKEQKK